MNTSLSLVKGGTAFRVRTVLRRPASDRWNVDAVKAMQPLLESQTLRICVKQK